MAENSKIEWTEHSFAPWFGCTKVSTGARGACQHCYAENLTDTRFGKAKFGGPGMGQGTRARSAVSTWKQPLAWNRKAEREGARPFVFCSHLSDVFDNQAPAAWRRDLFDIIRATPNLTWLLLTKRPQNILKLFGEAMSMGSNLDPEWTLPVFQERAWPRNAAIGCTVVTQEEADRDVPHLLAAKAALNPAFAFLSMEPLLGPVDLTRIKRQTPGAAPLDALRAGRPGMDYPALDWVITGGETDQGAHKARPSHPDWFRQIRDQCAAAGVAYHHKQNGEWAPMPDHLPTVEWAEGNGEPSIAWPDGQIAFGKAEDHGGNGIGLYRPGKARAGRLLDGVEHNARPVVAHG